MTAVRRQALALALLAAVLGGCPSEIPPAAPLACANLLPKRDAERRARIARAENERKDVELQVARDRTTGSLRHLNRLDLIRDTLAKDLKALDERYDAACKAGAPAPAASAEPSPATGPSASTEPAPVAAASSSASPAP